MHAEERMKLGPLKERTGTRVATTEYKSARIPVAQLHLGIVVCRVTTEPYWK